MSAFGVLNPGIEELYLNYDPAIDNIFIVSIDDDDLNKHAKLHAISVQYNGESLSLIRNGGTKNFQLAKGNSYTLTDKLSITWRENKNWEVRKFHEEWLKQFYNKETDQFQSTNNPSSLFKTFKIYLPGKDRDLVVVFNEVLPCNINDLNLKWSNTPNVIQHKLNYYVNGTINWTTANE